MCGATVPALSCLPAGRRGDSERSEKTWIRMNFLLALIFFCPFIALIPAPSLYLGYAFVLAVAIITRLIYKKPAFEAAQSISFAILFFAILIFISLNRSTDKPEGLLQAVNYLLGILLFVVCGIFSMQDKIRAIYVVLAAALIIGLASLYQYFFGFRHLLEYMARNNISHEFTFNYVSQKRSFFPFATPGILGGYLAMAIPLTFHFKNRFLFVPLLLFGALVATKSFDALISLLVGLNVYFYLLKKLSNREFILIFSLAILMGASFIFFEDFFEPYPASGAVSFMRLNTWGQSLQGILAHPLLGLGLGSLKLTLARYSHNLFLQIWAEMGILGLAAWLWIIYESFRVGMRKLKNPGSSENIAVFFTHTMSSLRYFFDTQQLKNTPVFLISLLASSAVFLSHNILNFSFFLPEVALIWWLIAGIIVYF